MGEIPREAGMITCPACGGPCGSGARACPHCAVELAATRCRKCFTLNLADARFCSRCGEAVEAELLLDATDAPCPRCAKSLGATTEAGAFECAACGGLFVDHTAFARLSAAKEKEVSPFAPPAQPLSPGRGPDSEVHYVKCPVCAEVMNRLNFGRRSGVIVDVCGLHGTWFDAGELTRVLEWIVSGGLSRARQAERDGIAVQQQRAASARAHAALEQHRGHVERGETGRSADLLLDTLFSMFRRDD